MINKVRISLFCIALNFHFSSSQIFFTEDLTDTTTWPTASNVPTNVPLGLVDNQFAITPLDSAYILVNQGTQFPGIYGVGGLNFQSDSSFQQILFDTYGYISQYNQFGVSVNGGDTVYLDQTFPLMSNGITIDFNISSTSTGSWNNSSLNFLGYIDHINLILFENGITQIHSENVAITVEEKRLPSIDIQLFPNPTKNQVQISTDKTIEAFQILSIDGRIIEAHQNLSIHNMEVDLSSYSSGIYLIYFELENGLKSTKKLIINP